MHRPTCRRAILSAVDAFLEGDPEHIAIGQALLEECERALIPWSIDSILWGELLGTLADSLYYLNPAYLHRIRTALRRGESDWHRVYVFTDFQGAMSTHELNWYHALNALFEYLSRFPFGSEVAVSEYEQRRAEVVTWQNLSPTPTRVGDETLYHLMLHEASSTLCSINAWASAIRYRSLVANTPYIALTDIDSPPDVHDHILAAGRVLQAIAGHQQLFINWRLSRNESVILTLQA